MMVMKIDFVLLGILISENQLTAVGEGGGGIQMKRL